MVHRKLAGGSGEQALKTTLLMRLMLWVALPLWLLRSGLILAAVPAPPGAVAQGLFGASMLAGLGARLRLAWRAGWPERAPPRMALGLTAFVLILLVGHALGLALVRS